MATEPEKTNTMLVKFEVDGREIELTPNILKEYIVGDQSVNITNKEFKMFAELCQVRKLNPFLKEAYLIKYGNQPAQQVVGKDAILKRAILNKDFNGREQGIIVINLKGEIEQRKGTFRMQNEELVGGWAKVYRKNWDHQVEITVSFHEVAQKKSNGELDSNWANKGATMVEKVALVRALRETFTEDLGGMIDENENWNNNEVGKGNRDIPESIEIIEQKEEIKKINLEDV